MAHLDGRMCANALGNRVRVSVELVDCPASEVVLPGIASLLLSLWRGRRPADEHIDNDLGLIVDNPVQALTNGALHVHIVDGTTVHEDTLALPHVRREHERNRSRGN